MYKKKILKNTCKQPVQLLKCLHLYNRWRLGYNAKLSESWWQLNVVKN